MSAPYAISEMFDGKLREARKQARHRVKEAGKLLRRAGKRVPAEIEADVRRASDEAATSAKGKDAAEILRAAERLGELVDKNLDGYRKPAWRESLESILIAVLVALLLRSFVVEAFKIPSGSMIPTLAIGDQIFVNKYVYGMRIPFTSIRLVDFSEPSRGDVVVFICPEPPNEDYIKRVIGVPGDQIEVRRGVVHINGEPVERELKGRSTYWDRDNATGRWYPFEAYTYEERLGDAVFTVIDDVEANPPQADFKPVIVPDGHVFVMGDNRDHSYDSRSWGLVPMSNILGRSLFVWWSWGREGLSTERLGRWID